MASRRALKGAPTREGEATSAADEVITRKVKARSAIALVLLIMAAALYIVFGDVAEEVEAGAGAPTSVARIAEEGEQPASRPRAAKAAASQRREPPQEFYESYPVPVFNASACPAKSVPLDGNCIHANNKLKCVGLRKEPGSAQPACQRPCGAFVMKMRGAGGIVFREGLLMALYGGAAFGAGPDESFIVSEGWAVGTARVDEKIAKFGPRGAVFMTALRHPVNRILSRYWYEGRWEMGKKDVSSASARPLEDWVDRVMAAEEGARPPARLWSCVSNYYVKSFAGWQGAPLCDGAAEAGCVGGVGPRQLAQAKALLAARFHAVLVTEWLDHPATVEWLGRLFCFPTRPRALRKHKKLGLVPFPLLAKKAAPGGHSTHRPAGWAPAAPALARLEALNALDLELFTWAAARLRRALGSLNGTSSGSSGQHGGAFPPLPEPAALAMGGVAPASWG